MAGYVTGRGEPISMRAVIQRLLSLPPITLDAEAEQATGEVPFVALVQVQRGAGLVLETRADIRRATGELLASYPWSQNLSSTTVNHRVDVPGSYVCEVVRSGVTGTGYTQLTKRIPITARPTAPPPPPPQVKPSISVQPKGDGSFVVSGTNFLPNATVHIRVVDAALNTFWFDQTSTAQGKLEFPTGRICQRGGTIHFSANDGRSDAHDLTGTLWSNTATTTCPF